ncbi:hypothetical protein DV737_g1369, partial [Chaetothyriales sp. CBS 132003]
MDVAENGAEEKVGSCERLQSLYEAEMERKQDEIRDACNDGDIAKLVELADSAGGPTAGRLDEDRQRQRRAAHRDEEQVRLDVDRAFVYYANDAPEKVMEGRKQALFGLIAGVLRRHSMLCYFQGYHDIAQVMMLVLGPEYAGAALDRLSLCRIRDYMLPSLTPALQHLQLVPAILKAADQELAGHLSMPHANYALPSALTLYAHDIQAYSDIARLFDFLLAHEPVISLYLFAAIILSRRQSLLAIPQDENDMLFFTLQKLPQPLDLESLIQEALRLFDQHPPQSLPGRAWRQISHDSVLKTSRSITAAPSLASAERSFERQARQVAWQEAKQKALRTAFKYRRPITSTALAPKHIRCLTDSRPNSHIATVKMANRGYDVVVDIDVDQEGDLGHTDLRDDDLEFHDSDFTNPPLNRKIAPDNAPFLSSATNPSKLPNDSSTTGSKRMLWSLSFYAQFFDVDTSTVLHRCRTALIPFLPNTPPFLDTLDGNPDLYGPFWIATTVVVILFLTGTISHKLATEKKQHFEYDFKLLSGAAGLIYGYTLFVPLGLWAALRWFGAQSLELVECWALYGYGNLFWIAVALVSWSPLDGLNYALVAAGYAISVFFLVKNLYPAISVTDKKTSQVLLLIVVLLHAGLAIAIKILFFSHKSPAKKDAGGDGDRRILLF